MSNRLPIPAPALFAEEMHQLAPRWFAEASYRGSADEADIDAWKKKMQEWGYCMSGAFWDRVDWAVEAKDRRKKVMRR